MKFLLISTFIVLFVAGICANLWSDEGPLDTRSDKERLHEEILRIDIVKLIDHVDEVESLCPRLLLNEEKDFFNLKLVELIQCRNATIDIFMDKFDDDVNFDDIDSHSKAVQIFAEPLCEIYHDIFRCIGGFRPAVDLCLSEKEKIWLDKIFSIVPLIQQTVCLRNGALIAEIAGHDNGLKCINRIANSLSRSSFNEIIQNNSTEMFGDIGVCQRFNVFLHELYFKFDQCSHDVLVMVREMLGFFCEATQCARFVHDLKCHTY